MMGGRLPVPGRQGNGSLAAVLASTDAHEGRCMAGRFLRSSFGGIVARGANMKAWLRSNFRDPKTSFASAMALTGGLGVLCCCAIVLIVLLNR